MRKSVKALSVGALEGMRSRALEEMPGMTFWNDLGRNAYASE